MDEPDLPFLPYSCQSIDEDDIAAVVAVLRSDYLTTGPAVPAFEEALAAEVGSCFAVAVANGTAALHAACFAAGVGPGDEVIVPAVTFAATANCARYLDAEPIFADVDPQSGLILPTEVERRLSPRTRAVIPVHLTGRPVDVEAVAAPVRRAGAVVIEDAAHALGASWGERRIGDCSWSSMAILSFHPVKQMTTGEGGAVVTNDEERGHLLRCFRNHGNVREGEGLPLLSPSPGPWYYEQQLLGHNLRITDLQCALGLSQLRKLRRFVARRRSLAARYDRLLAGLHPHVVPVCPPAAGGAWASAYHLYAVLIDFAALGRERATVMRQLKAQRIGTQVHYIPVPFQPYYRQRGWRAEDFPGAARYYARTLSLPLFPAMGEADVERVVGALAQALGLG